MNDPFGIYEIPIDREPQHWGKLGWYSIEGHEEYGVPYQLVVSDEGRKLTYYRPKHWTQEEWDEFCDEMEEDVLGDQASDE